MAAEADDLPNEHWVFAGQLAGEYAAETPANEAHALTGVRVKPSEPVNELLTERFVTEISPEPPTVCTVAQSAKVSTEHESRAVVGCEAWQDEHRMLISTRRGQVKKRRGCG